jgi:5-methylcytosine-specific restriction protein A
MTVGCGGGASGAELGAKLIEYSRLVDVINLQFSTVAAEFAKTDQYDQEGFDSPISWIKANCHLPGGAAGDRVCVGEQEERLSESTLALAEGRIGYAHFALIARTAAAVGERFDERKLLRKAQKLSVRQFRNACTHARHEADPDGFVKEEKEGVEARSLTISTADDGVVLINCILDKVGGAAVQTALEPLAKRAGKDDDRLRDRRLADALVDLAMNALDKGKPSQRPHLQVTTTLETLLGLSGAPAAEMEFSLPISAKAVERLACDCSVTRVLLG